LAHTEKVSGPLGTLGVDIFFVLSGFLITCLLIEEFDQFHFISLKAFYARRILRLLPALLLMLSVLVTFHWFFSSRAAALQTTADAFIALFYSTNWALVFGFRQPGHTFAHTWTLSIEEQFYLTWPAILLLMLRRTKSRASMLTWLVFSLFLLGLEKVTILAAVPRGSIGWINCATECRADSLVVGCCLAIAMSSGFIGHKRWVDFLVKFLVWFMAVPGILLLSISPISVGFYRIGYHLTAAIFIAVIILRALRDGAGILGRFLAQPWLVYIGKISYGLYLWHYPVFVWVQAQHWRTLKELTIEVSITCAATLLSYYLLERPFLQLKRNFTRLRNA
jgi:peptidoglycan/LPS O-acetylase OafA/YrhL